MKRTGAIERALRWGLAAGIGLACLATGCTQETAATGRDYTVRGQVRRLPEPADPKSLWLLHEPIDDWAGRDGKIQGMDSMAMPFDLAAGVSLEGLQVNDIVEFTLHVDWNAGTPVEITQVRELPPDTRLDLREARPPQDGT